MVLPENYDFTREGLTSLATSTLTDPDDLAALFNGSAFIGEIRIMALENSNFSSEAIREAYNNKNNHKPDQTYTVIASHLNTPDDVLITMSRELDNRSEVRNALYARRGKMSDEVLLAILKMKPQDGREGQQIVELAQAVKISQDLLTRIVKDKTLAPQCFALGYPGSPSDLVDKHLNTKRINLVTLWALVSRGGLSMEQFKKVLDILEHTDMIKTNHGKVTTSVGIPTYGDLLGNGTVEQLEYILKNHDYQSVLYEAQRAQMSAPVVNYLLGNCSSTLPNDGYKDWRLILSTILKHNPDVSAETLKGLYLCVDESDQSNAGVKNFKERAIKAIVEHANCPDYLRTFSNVIG